MRSMAWWPSPLACGAPEPDERPAPHRRRHPACSSLDLEHATPPAPRRAAPRAVHRGHGQGGGLGAFVERSLRGQGGVAGGGHDGAPTSPPWQIAPLASTGLIE
jgi:hypothetical protein